MIFIVGKSEHANSPVGSQDRNHGIVYRQTHVSFRILAMTPIVSTQQDEEASGKSNASSLTIEVLSMQQTYREFIGKLNGQCGWILLSRET